MERTVPEGRLWFLGAVRLSAGFWKLEFGETVGPRHHPSPKVFDYECRTPRPWFTHGNGSAAQIHVETIHFAPDSHFAREETSQKGSWDCSSRTAT